MSDYCVSCKKNAGSSGFRIYHGKQILCDKCFSSVRLSANKLAYAIDDHFLTYDTLNELYANLLSSIESASYSTDVKVLLYEDAENLFIEYKNTLGISDEGGDGDAEEIKRRIAEEQAEAAIQYKNRKKYLEERDKYLEERDKALSSMLITSGFTFDGYKITKYSGYISGDDAIQVDRGATILGFGATNVGDKLTDSLVQIRRRALKELKEAAYDLGCNAVIGVDFDYITLEPETASVTGGTTYLPYVFCVTANGNAVVIEKDNEQESLNLLRQYKDLLDCGAITQEEYEIKKKDLL